ncbi:MAG TPA: CPBP family glutamic-type intramembrane protease [Actinomycetota bacterium]|nr:CPBP family glutamic-type intramembrane protease [Actinomycetota bacterium]
MTATNPSAAGAGQPAVQPQPSAAAVAGGVGGAALLVATRVALWLGVQLLLAGLLVLGGAEPFGRALNEAAGWWMVYGALVDLGTPPMFAVVDLPPLASVVSVLVVPLLTELAEPVAYLGVVLPRLEARLGRAWLAATIVVVVWAAEHACFPLLASGGGLDLEFAAYRVGSVLPYLAIWTALYYALGRRLLPVMAARWAFNGGTALALALGLAG